MPSRKARANRLLHGASLSRGGLATHAAPLCRLADGPRVSSLSAAQNRTMQDTALHHALHRG